MLTNKRSEYVDEKKCCVVFQMTFQTTFKMKLIETSDFNQLKVHWDFTQNQQWRRVVENDLMQEIDRDVC